MFGRPELERLAEIAAAADLVVCADEIHCGLVLDADRAHIAFATLAPEAARRSITLMAPSKTFNLSGLGCAFAVIPAEPLRRRFVQAKAGIVPMINPFGYLGAQVAYRECGDWLSAQLAYLRANRDLVERWVAATPGLAMAHVEATYLAWIDSSGLGASDPQTYFLERGVALSPGAQYGDARFVRLNFGTQRALLAEALARMGHRGQTPILSLGV